MKPERRLNNRKEVYPLTISSLAVMDGLAKIVRNATIVNASSRGMLIHIDRADLIPRSLRNSLTLDPLVGDMVVLRIEEMNLEISGKITRTKLLGKKGFEVALDYSEESPQYWRDCLMDLLPGPNEFDESPAGGSSRLVPLKGYKRQR